MKHILSTLAVLTALSLGTAHAAGEQVWNAEINNTQKSCGIDFAPGSTQVGGILLQGESQSSSQKGLTFNLTSNTRQTSWSITEAKITQNAGRFAFDDNLLNVGGTNLTSVVVNDKEYAWSQVNQERQLQSNERRITLAPKINMQQQELPLGTTRIQGKIVLTCAD